VYWCTADIGWVTGHSYIVYGPLANGTTTVMYEGTPDYPDKDRFWRIVEKYGVTICYTAPTAIRTFMRWGEEFPKRCDLSSLRLLGSVGEPINPEAWVWYWKVIGGGRCPVVDTWWQTETGHIMITPLPGVTTLKPGSATRPFPGVEAEVVNDKGEPAKAGYLVLKKPWPGMLRGIYRDPQRFVAQYWSKYPGVYFTGDGAKLDEEGYFWLLGRVDDVMNISGHRVSTMEVESALVDNPHVAEAAVIGRLRDHQGRHQAQQGADRGAEGARGQEDRGPRAARRSHLHLGSAQDPLGQDHAPAAPRHRGGEGAGRYHDPGGPGGGRSDQGEVRGGGVGSSFVRETPPRGGTTPGTKSR
jgi:acetyl-CoA synthetase